MGRRNRRGPRASVAVKARTPPPGAISFTSEQLAAMLGAQAQLARGNMRAQPMPSSPFWETSPFGPGRRLPPAPINTVRPDTGRAEPRLWEYPVAWNLQIDGRRHVPWKTLQDAADMPLFRKCIERRKSVCELEFTVGVDPRAVAREAALSGGHEKDIESSLRDRYTADIARISDWLTEPDRKNGYDWKAWTSLLMENRLVFDATVIYPRMTYGGDVAAFEVIDGKTIKPLLDEYGGRPLPPLPAFQQILYGFPRGEFTADTVTEDGQTITPGLPADQMLYERTIIRPHSPYGMSATEIALLDGLVWMRRMGWILAEYTEGVLPAAFLRTSPETDWTVTQWEEWLRALNDHLGGNTQERNKFALFPPGVDPVESATVPEKYKADYDLFLIKLVAGDFGLPASEVGFTETGALGASFHEGEEDILNRQTRRPDANWIGRIATRLAVRYLGMPPVLQVQVLGLESEDEAAADQVALSQVQSGRMTLNEDRARRGEAPYDFAEADMPQLQMARGVVFLEGASQQAPPGTLIGPAVAPPGLPPATGAAGQQPGGGSVPPGQNVGAAGQGHGQQNDDGQPDDATAKSEPAPGSAASELAAYRRWAKRGGPRGQFTAKAIARADAPPDMAADGRVLFKDGGPDPKALSGRGLAGTGTRTS